jgi:putative spermidine/putrescine transport system permease protein
MSRAIFWASLVLSFLFLVLPLAVVLPLAFNSSDFLNYPITGLTTHWFMVVLQQPPWLQALGNSMKVAVGATAVAVLVGGLAATGTMLAGRISQIVLSALFVSPLVVPSVVTGVAMAYAFGRAGISGSYGSLVLAHSLLGAPLVFLSVMTALRGLDQELERAGMSMGASRLYRFWTITFPLTLPGFATGALFAFITSFDEVVVTLFLASPQSRTLPIVLFSSLRDKLDPTMVAVACVLTLLSLIFIIALNWLQRRDRVPTV